MKLTDNQRLIYRGKICPYCNLPSEYVSSLEVYNTDYGMIYLCRPCNAYVGCHAGTDKALGRLANSVLRKWKIEAHKHFDFIWKSKRMRRGEAYKWLSKQIEVPLEYTHIGMLSEETLKKVCDVSIKFMHQNKKIKKKKAV